jgi:hypothetical protein
MPSEELKRGVCAILWPSRCNRISASVSGLTGMGHRVAPSKEPQLITGLRLFLLEDTVS